MKRALANRVSTPDQVRGRLSLETAIEEISADRHAGSTNLHRSRNRHTISVTATGTSSVTVSQSSGDFEKDIPRARTDFRSWCALAARER
jgi:hypothetical protein